jgi:hypothetical protein
VKNVRRLLAAVRAINAHADVRLSQVADNEDMWVIRVAVHDVILIETAGGFIEVAVAEATKKIESMSQRIFKAANSEPPSSK